MADQRGQKDPSPPNATPIDRNEIDGLIPEHLETQAELNQWEAVNIADAERWASQLPAVDVLSTMNLKDLHRRMFSETWQWAGAYRTSDKNISPYHWTRVPELMENLVANTRARFETSDPSPGALDEIAARFHHQLVHIHPWPNGNGRHARLATDLLLRSWDRPPFTWGGSENQGDADLRARYVTALRHADAGDYSSLNRFVRG
ncbi:MAG: mobile mystery protein B [Gemmatimonadaceae bacterium]